jgi:hypothetical protein
MGGTERADNGRDRRRMWEAARGSAGSEGVVRWHLCAYAAAPSASGDGRCAGIKPVRTVTHQPVDRGATHHASHAPQTIYNIYIYIWMDGSATHHTRSAHRRPHTPHASSTPHTPRARAFVRTHAHLAERRLGRVPLEHPQRLVGVAQEHVHLRPHTLSPLLPLAPALLPLPFSLSFVARSLAPASHAIYPCLSLPHDLCALS